MNSAANLAGHGVCCSQDHSDPENIKYAMMEATTCMKVVPCAATLGRQSNYLLCRLTDGSYKEMRISDYATILTQNIWQLMPIHSFNCIMANIMQQTGRADLKDSEFYMGVFYTAFKQHEQSIGSSPCTCDNKGTRFGAPASWLGDDAVVALPISLKKAGVTPEELVSLLRRQTEEVWVPFATPEQVHTFFITLQRVISKLMLVLIVQLTCANAVFVCKPDQLYDVVLCACQ